jgi:hypothetical protein
MILEHNSFEIVSYSPKCVEGKFSEFVFSILHSPCPLPPETVPSAPHCPTPVPPLPRTGATRYSPNSVEWVFSELRLDGVLRSSTLYLSENFTNALRTGHRTRICLAHPKKGRWPWMKKSSRGWLCTGGSCSCCGQRGAAGSDAPESDIQRALRASPERAIPPEECVEGDFCELRLETV